MKFRPLLLKNHGGRSINHAAVGGLSASLFGEASSNDASQVKGEEPKSGIEHVLQLAARLQAEGNYVGAAAMYRSVLKQDPSNEKAKLGLEAVAEGAEEQEKTLEERRREEQRSAEARSASTSPRGVPRMLPEVVAQKGSVDKVAQAKASAQKNLQVGQALRIEGDIAGAEAAFRMAARLDPQLADAHDGLALALKARGDVAGALGTCRAALEVLQSAAAGAKLRHRLGTLLQDEGELEAAAEAYQAALMLDPTMDGAHFNLGTVLQQRGELQKAVEAYQGALSRDQSHAGAQHNLGLVLAQLGDLDAAAAAFRVAADLEPKSASVRNNLGNVLVRMDDLEAAAQAFRAAVELDSSLASAHDNLGAVLFELGDLDAAACAFQAALAVDPHMADAHTHLGQVLRDRGEFGSAAEAFREALKVDPSQAAVHCDLGLALKLQGDLEGALGSFSTALDLEPGNPEMRSTYEELLKARRSQQSSKVAKPRGAAGRSAALDYSRFDHINSDSD